MTNDITIFENEDFGSVRTTVIDGEPWFVVKDVADALGYSNSTKAMKDHIDKDDLRFNDSLKLSRQAGAWLTNESGLYSLILSSKLPNAKKFKHWVTSEVLPSIRKNGAYMTPETIEKVLTSPDFIISLATKLKEEQTLRKQAEATIEEQKPKVLFADSVSSSDSSILVGELAKIMKQNGYETGERRLYETLRNDGFLIKRRGTDRNMPTQRAMEKGLFEIVETTVIRDGNVFIAKTPKVTGTGQIFFINKYCKLA